MTSLPQSQIMIYVHKNCNASLFHVTVYGYLLAYVLFICIYYIIYAYVCICILYITYECVCKYVDFIDSVHQRARTYLENFFWMSWIEFSATLVNSFQDSRADPSSRILCFEIPCYARPVRTLVARFRLESTILVPNCCAKLEETCLRLCPRLGTPVRPPKEWQFGTGTMMINDWI